jgi:acetyl esterase/lipase
MRPLDLERFLDGLASWVADADWPVATHRYGPHPEHEADLRLPPGPGPHATVVLLHGGFWRARFTRTNTAALAVDLARRGFATWNVEYRRVGCDGGVPATLEDVEAALDAVQSVNAPLDRSRLLVAGHSAGGHLALRAAGTRKVSGAVSLAGVCDLADAARAGLGDGAASAFAGGMPDERPRAYALADPMARLPAGVPQLLVHGDADDRVPIEHSYRYARAARAAGDRCELLELPRVGHFELIDPRTEAWQQAAASIERLSRSLK